MTREDAISQARSMTESGAVGREAVELTADLTRYHSGLVTGAWGITDVLHPRGMWARSQDRFVSVDFGAGVGWHDVLWKSLRREEATP